jgi:hypothetical protein
MLRIMRVLERVCPVMPSTCAKGLIPARVTIVVGCALLAAAIGAVGLLASSHGPAVAFAEPCADCFCDHWLVLPDKGGDSIHKECGRISEQCSGWIYAGLCRLGKREVQACRYCERDCDTGEKRCHRVHRKRCKIAV